jgi:membrane-associated phospholipid phosphatase
MNQSLFQLINSQATTIIEPALWETVTILGDGLVVIVLLLPLHKKHPKLTITVLLSGIVAALWIHLLKAGLAVPRPPAIIDSQMITVLGPEFKNGSFPSGHTSTLFALLGCMALWMKGPLLRYLFPFMLLLGFLAALSRNVVGIHWPLDIMVGMAIGWLSAMVANLLMRTSTISDITKFWVGRFLFLCALYLLLVYDTGYANAKAFQHAIALIVLGVVCMEGLKTPSPQRAKSLSEE